MKSQTILVGIVGISGSGKTTIANSIVKKLREDKQNVSYIRTDHYYKDLSHLTKEEFEQYDFDKPESMDMDGLYNDILKLLDNSPIDRRFYPYASNSDDETTPKILPARIIVVEGIFLLADERLRKLFSLIFLVDTPLDCAIVRRITRDVEASSDFCRTLHRYETQIRPASFSNILNLKNYAHYILSNENKEARISSIQMATAIINSKLNVESKQENMLHTAMRYSPLLLGFGVFAYKILIASANPALTQDLRR